MGVERGAEKGLIGLQQRGRVIDVDHGGLRADGDAYIDANRLVQGDFNRVSLHRGKSGCFDFQRVTADGQGRDVIHAVGVGFHRVVHTVADLMCCDRGVRDDGARGIMDGAGDL